MQTVHIFWSRKDLRLTDNPALTAALAAATSGNNYFLPVFILEDYMLKAQPSFQFGYAQRVFLSKALPEFASLFKHFVLLTGRATHRLGEIDTHLHSLGYAVHVHVNEDVHPDFYSQVGKLKNRNINITVYTDQLTIDSGTRTQNGEVYSIFTPFKKRVWAPFLTASTLPKVDTDKPTYLPKKTISGITHQIDIVEGKIFSRFSDSRLIQVVGRNTHQINLQTLTQTLPDLSGWYFSEREALKRMDSYLLHHLSHYNTRRDLLGLDVQQNGTSRMSLALTWGFISSRTIREHVQKRCGSTLDDLDWFTEVPETNGAITYLSELIWREFYKYLLYHYPNLLQEEFQVKYRGRLSWTEETEAIGRFKAWITGNTGYQIVDAAMQQIARTGWMHNRCRMIVASVLTKNFGVDWRWGQEYFRAQLVDLDEASNNGGWQWSASVGADPKPIRIFNPYLQEKKFDPHGIYRKHWLGSGYNLDKSPIVSHSEARKDAMRRYGLLKN